jgi:hypothetical protein
MEVESVLVVGESASLGRSIADLLTTSGLKAQFVRSLEDLTSLETAASDSRVVVAASPGFYCSTLRVWMRGGLPGSKLIVVASRDPLLDRAGGVLKIDLPLDAAQLVEAVCGYLSASSPRGTPVS